MRLKNIKIYPKIIPHRNFLFHFVVLAPPLSLCVFISNSEPVTTTSQSQQTFGKFICFCWLAYDLTPRALKNLFDTTSFTPSAVCFLPFHRNKKLNNNKLQGKLSC